MILKIARYKDNRDWWIIDGIKRINYGLEEVKRKDIRIDPDILIEDFYENISTFEENQTISTICMTCRMADDEEKYIEFDTIAYLCNDEGKTIEKIVANYNVREPNRLVGNPGGPEITEKPKVIENPGSPE